MLVQYRPVCDSLQICNNRCSFNSRSKWGHSVLMDDYCKRGFRSDVMPVLLRLMFAYLFNFCASVKAFWIEPQLLYMKPVNRQPG
jgi:hypothetical protein